MTGETECGYEEAELLAWMKLYWTRGPSDEYVERLLTLTLQELAMKRLDNDVAKSPGSGPPSSYDPRGKGC